MRRQRPLRRPLPWACLTLAALLGASAPAPARGDTPARGTDLKEEMAVVAKQVKLLLDQKGQDSIAVGDFRAPAHLNASSGPAITKALSEAIQATGVTVKRLADLEINGEYREVDDKKTKKLAVRIKAQVVDRTGEVVTALQPRGIFSLAEIAALTGVTAVLPANASDEERTKRLGDAIEKPSVHMANTRIGADADSPYGIEVLVKSKEEYLPRAATKDADGFASLKIRRDETYAIKLINDSKHDAAVTLTIDGLSVFAFSENKNYSHWIVPAGKTLTVPGWHRTNKESDTFLVTEYSKSAAAESLPNSATVGTVTASFAAAWPKGGTPPSDEASFKKLPSRSADGTAKGPPIKTGFVEVVREIGLVRASVSVRYNKGGDPANLPPGTTP